MTEKRNLFGTVWVDEKNLGVLIFETEEESIERMRGVGADDSPADWPSYTYYSSVYPDSVHLPIQDLILGRKVLGFSEVIGPLREYVKRSVIEFRKDRAREIAWFKAFFGVIKQMDSRF